MPSFCIKHTIYTLLFMLYIYIFIGCCCKLVYNIDKLISQAAVHTYETISTNFVSQTLGSLAFGLKACSSRLSSTLSFQAFGSPALGSQLLTLKLPTLSTVHGVHCVQALPSIISFPLSVGYNKRVNIRHYMKTALHKS